jgi:glycosyltransferase involved in cell wall biosynthesis
MFMGYDKYSVLMPLYKNDDPEWFQYALDSLLNQTIKPSEIVIICDGPLSVKLEKVLKENIEKNPELYQIYRFEKNVGLGVALNKGITLCSNELIVRMDADDYAVPERCEKEIKKFNTHPDFDVVGCNVEEFIGDINNVVSHVVLPEKQNEIIKFAKKRCPIRHPALMYKKSAVLKAGNYRDYRHAQDYNLIVHMILSGAQIYNIQENLMYMRVSPNFYKRRGGIEQAKLVLRLKKEFYDYKFYSLSDFVVSGIGNAVIALLPNKMREFFYKKMLRK